MLRSTTTIAAACLILAACSSTEKTEPTTQAASMGAINDSCPIMNEPIDPEVTTQYAGQTVGFCCAGCIGKWDDMSAAAKADFVAKATGN